MSKGKRVVLSFLLKATQSKLFGAQRMYNSIVNLFLAQNFVDEEGGSKCLLGRHGH